MSKEKANPFVKWAGGKSKLVETILEKVSESVNLNEMEHYIEPFVGGGAMFFYLAQTYKFKSMTIIDINLDLINTYKAIQKDPVILIEGMNSLQNEYNSLVDIEEKKLFFYKIRDFFNQGVENLDTTINFQRAAQFIFLNKTCFNGLYRVNKSGRFNVPFGQKNKINIYDQDNIINIHEILKHTTILHANYDKVLELVNSKTFIYFDPPYKPITASAAFTSYAKDGFNDDDQDDLAQLCKKLKQLGVHFAVSNSDPKNPDSDEPYFDKLYGGFTIHRISAARNIAAKSKSRSAVSEILVVG
ncbi:DNA adenine methylase [Rummeliibacillus sp. JY-2-4R]